MRSDTVHVLLWPMSILLMKILGRKKARAIFWMHQNFDFDLFLSFREVLYVQQVLKERVISLVLIPDDVGF
jgi:hypothetical protein